jgi:hypothetical protein
MNKITYDEMKAEHFEEFVSDYVFNKDLQPGLYKMECRYRVFKNGGHRFTHRKLTRLYQD